MTELTSSRNELDPLSADRRGALERSLERTGKEAAALEEQGQVGSSCLFPSFPGAFTQCAIRARAATAHQERKRHLEEAKHQLEVAQRKGDYEAA